MIRILTMAVFWSACITVAQAGTVACSTPDDAAGAVSALPRVAEALKPGKVLSVLAVGSATMFGPEASLDPSTISGQSLTGRTSPAPVPQVFNRAASEQSFPMLMAAALREAVPGAEVKVTVRGGRGLLAADMLTILRTEVATHAYNLVLWQTGTVEAVRNLPPGEFSQTLLDGAEAVREGGADLVLIDPQFSRFLQTNANLEPYTQALVQTAAMPGVVLFHRFDMMRNWVNEGQLDLERTPKADRKKSIEFLHACLGKYLGKLVLDSSRS